LNSRLLNRERIKTEGIYGLKMNSAHGTIPYTFEKDT